MSSLQHRHRSRGWESSLIDGVLLLCMMAGTVVAVLVLMLALGCAVGILSF